MNSKLFFLLGSLFMISASSQSATLECGAIKSPQIAEEMCDPISLSAIWVAPSESQWVRDIRGLRSDFVNIYVHGNLEKLGAALVAGGWTRSVDNNRKDNSLYLHSVLTYEHARLTENETQNHLSLQKKLESTGYLTKVQNELRNTYGVIASMPVSNEYMCGHLQIAAFEKGNNPFGGRHHLRVWDTRQKDTAGQPVLAIVGSHDTGLMFDAARPGQFFLNHRVEPDTDLERDIIVSDLKISGEIAHESDLSVTFSCPAPKDKLFSADQRIKELFLK